MSNDISARMTQNNGSIAQEVSNRHESDQVEFGQAPAPSVSQQVQVAVSKALAGTEAAPAVYQEVSNTVLKIVNQPGVNFSSMSIDAVISLVMLDRYSAMQDLVQEQAKRVQKMNDQLRALGMIKAALAVYGTDTSKPDDTVDLNKPGSSLDEMKKITADNNLDIDWGSFEIKGTTITKGNLAKLNQTIDTLTTSATNTQSAEYNKLQDYAQKLTQALDLASNVSKKLFDTTSGIIGNIR
jgi:hypothetical protein